MGLQGSITPSRGALGLDGSGRQKKRQKFSIPNPEAEVTAARALASSPVPSRSLGDVLSPDSWGALFSSELR